MKRRPNPYGPSFCLMNTCKCTAEQHEWDIRAAVQMFHRQPQERSGAGFVLLMIFAIPVLCFLADMCQRVTR